MPEHNFETIVLTPLDHVQTSINEFLFLSFQQPESRQSLQSLHAAVTKLVANIPLLGGEVRASERIPGKRNVLEVRPASASLEQVPMLQVRHHACALRTHPHGVSPFNEPTTSYDESFCPVPVSIPPSQPRPVMRFQANVLLDGIVLCIGFNHSVLDCTGAGGILSLLAKCCSNNIETESLSQICKNEIALRNSFSTSLSGPYKKEDYTRDFGSGDSDARDLELPGATLNGFLSTSLRTRAFLFSSSKIQILKDTCMNLAQSKRACHEHGPKFVSSNDIVTAVMAACIYRAQSVGSKRGRDSPHLAMAVNNRGRFHPPLPGTYIGNGATVLRVPLDGREDISHHLSPVSFANSCPGLKIEDFTRVANLCNEIRSRLDRQDDKYLRGLISYVQDADDWGNVEMRYGDIIISSLRSLGSYSLDFGPSLGKVKSVDTQEGLNDGMAHILPASEDKNPPWDIRIVLNSEDMENLMNDSLLHWVLASEA